MYINSNIYDAHGLKVHSPLGHKTNNLLLYFLNEIVDINLKMNNRIASTSANLGS